jgi:hypothetical protein
MNTHKRMLVESTASPPSASTTAAENRPRPSLPNSSGPWPSTFGLHARFMNSEHSTRATVVTPSTIHSRLQLLAPPEPNSRPTTVTGTIVAITSLSTTDRRYRGSHAAIGA